MSIDQVIGVDFSGAKKETGTWVASGVLHPDGLHVNCLRSVSRAELLGLLQQAPDGAVASLDFPFSVPRPFAEVLAASPRDMANVWAAVDNMSIQKFRKLRDRFVTKHGELKRKCDQRHTGAFSPLHVTNPNMLPMTLRGMQLLHRLHAPDVRILCQDQPGPARLTVLECMPGFTLKGLGLPDKGYKGGEQRFELRRRILDGLTSAPVPLANVEEIHEQCLSKHDALDAVVAALTSAIYLAQPEIVSLPPEEDIYRLEGWIFHIRSDLL